MFWMSYISPPSCLQKVVTISIFLLLIFTHITLSRKNKRSRRNTPAQNSIPLTNIGEGWFYSTSHISQYININPVLLLCFIWHICSKVLTQQGQFIASWYHRKRKRREEEEGREIRLGHVIKIMILVAVSRNHLPI